jgi:YD repeat-containing protein
MSITYTPNYQMAKPDRGTPEWDDEINGNFDVLDTTIKGLELVLLSHTNNTNNPHQVTYTQVGAAPTIHNHTGNQITSAVAEAINADKVDGYDVGNSSGQIPLSNGTLCASLNADKVDGYDASISSTPNTIAVRDDNGGLSARILTSTVEAGTAPISVSSPTVCTNLNSDKVDGYDASDFFLLGNTNQSINLFRALNQQIDTRSLILEYDTSGNLTTVTEMDGSTIVKTTTLTYDSDGNLSTVTEVVGGRTIITTLVYDGNGNLTEVTRQVS